MVGWVYVKLKIVRRDNIAQKDVREFSDKKILFVGAMMPRRRMRIKPRQIVRRSGNAVDTNAAQFQATCLPSINIRRESRASAGPLVRPTSV